MATALPPTITASTWDAALRALALRTRLGTQAVQLDGRELVVVPRWTNAEAVSVIDAISRAAGSWDMAYQYAAPAYGWDPDRDYLTSSTQQSSAEYPADLTALLLEGARGLLGGSDPQDVRLSFTEASWKEWMERTARSLRGDGASASFKIPVPACKGRNKFPRRGADGKWHCDPVMIDDPVTAIGKSAGRVLVLALLAMIAYEAVRSRRR